MSCHSAFSRHSTRLCKYDYSQSRYYFFTICTTGHKSIFGRILDYKMECNRAGDAVWSAWRELPLRFPAIQLDAFVVMPNHIHGILLLSRPEVSTGQRPAGRASPAPTQTIANTARRGDPWVARRDSPSRGAPDPVSLGKIIGAFKSLSAAAINRALHRTGSVWQRNYYDHIVRTANDLDAIRAYIAQNPAQWANDRENPLSRGFLGAAIGPS